jgi:hypothetical protein
VRKQGSASWSTLALLSPSAKSLFVEKQKLPSLTWNMPQTYEFRVVYICNAERKSSNVFTRTFESVVEN